MAQNGSENVGIGDSNPDYKLSIKDNSLPDGDTSLLKLEGYFSKQFLNYQDIIGIQFVMGAQAEGYNMMPFAMNGDGDVLIGRYDQDVAIGKDNASYDLDVDGYAAATNMVATIPLWQGGSEYNMFNTLGDDLSNCKSGLIPTIYSSDGNIDVKLIIRVTSSAGTQAFQLRAHNGIQEVYPISNSDSWTWYSTESGYVVTSEWKSWSAGTSPWEIHLYGWIHTGANALFNSAYLLVRPHQD